MLAALASRSTVSQPDSTTGENAITSTRWAMNERNALIWFSCFCCASEKRSWMPALASDDLIDAVLAVRHSLSAPIWLNPSTGCASRSLPASREHPPMIAAHDSAAASKNPRCIPLLPFWLFDPSVPGVVRRIGKEGLQPLLGRVSTRPRPGYRLS